MKLFVISIAYYEPDVMGMSVGKFYRTSGIEKIDGGIARWILVDNQWPIKPDNMELSVNRLAKFMGAEVITTEKNLGGHGGTSFGLNHLEFEDEDLILMYDLDLYPLTQDWLVAMLEVMEADKTIGLLCLLNKKEKEHSGGHEVIAGEKVFFPNEPQMWMTSVYRGKVLRKGLLSPLNYYGLVELSMSAHIKECGMRIGYLEEFFESDPPIKGPEIYERYKREHAHQRTFTGSFEDFIKREEGK